MTELEKEFLRFKGCSEEKIEQIEREKDYFLLEGPEPYYFIQGYEIAERKYIKQIEKMECCYNCKHSEINFTSDSGIKLTCKKLRRKSDDCILNNYKDWELAE